MTYLANTNDIHIWLYRIDSLVAREVIKPYQKKFVSLFQRAENAAVVGSDVQQMRNFSFIMRRIILSDFTGMPVDELRFHSNLSGKPLLLESKVNFNISHSGPYWCMALTEGQEIGLDIELIQKRKYEEEIVKSYFLENEQALYFQESDRDKRTILFFQLWTEKEAIAKMQGVGILEELSRKQTANETFQVARLDKKELAIAWAINRCSQHNVQFLSDFEE
jgi:phosphopantetheinyl transferase